MRAFFGAKMAVWTKHPNHFGRGQKFWYTHTYHTHYSMFCICIDLMESTMELLFCGGYFYFPLDIKAASNFGLVKEVVFSQRARCPCSCIHLKRHFCQLTDFRFFAAPHRSTFASQSAVCVQPEQLTLISETIFISAQ